MSHSERDNPTTEVDYSTSCRGFDAREDEMARSVKPELGVHYSGLGIKVHHL
jgi:hypothetical protein